MDDTDAKTQERFERLKKILRSMESVVIAYSGGVDSTFLAKAAKDELGDGSLAVTARSETYVQSEFEQAKRLAETWGFRHLVIETKELEYPNYARNPVDRCYHCKSGLFSELKRVAREQGMKWVADGSNADDLKDYRPGLRALQELEIRSPLREAGLSKADIRTLSRSLGLETWNKPAVACLGSRFPYGTEITLEKLSMLERAEIFLHGLGLSQVRVRHHDSLARIEVLPGDIQRLSEPGLREKVVQAFKEIGYVYVALDLQGYRTGSMNETLDSPKRAETT